MGENNVISTQKDFERAFLSGKGEINLTAGTFRIPAPDEADNVYLFQGVIKGAARNQTKLVGEIGVKGCLILKQLSIYNDQPYNGIFAGEEKTLILDDVYVSNTENLKLAGGYCAVYCGAGTQLLAKQVKVDYDTFASVNLDDGCQGVIKDSSLQGLEMQADNANLVLDTVDLGVALVKGDNQVLASNLSLKTHPNFPKKYIHFTEQSSHYEKFKDKRWFFFLDSGKMQVHDLHLPAELPPKLGLFFIENAHLTGNIADSAERKYQPWVEAEGDSKVELAGAKKVAPSRRDVTTTSKPNNHEAIKQLQQLIGLTTVKQQVNTFIQVALMNTKRKKAGMKAINNSLHSLFAGNPGTGKTTVARLVGAIMYEEGILPTDKYVEVDRGDLVAGYVGQTAKQTMKVLKEATGGVLFIDEAYDLVHSSDDSFGKEALDTIMKYMEDHRDELMIIFAGYTEDMQKLLQQNPGMKSRVPNIFNFEDYSAEDIAAIGRLLLKKEQLQFDQPQTEELYNQLVEEQYENSNDHSNGRWIRNQNDLLMRQLALATSNDANHHPLDKIWADDVKKAFSNVNTGSIQSNSSQPDFRTGTSNNRPLPRTHGDHLPLLNGDEL